MTIFFLFFNICGQDYGSIHRIIAKILNRLLDNWLEDIVPKHTAGEVKSFRYADDQIICCHYILLVFQGAGLSLIESLAGVAPAGSLSPKGTYPASARTMGIEVTQ